MERLGWRAGKPTFQTRRASPLSRIDVRSVKIDYTVPENGVPFIPKQFNLAKIVERMVNQNTYDDVAQGKI